MAAGVRVGEEEFGTLPFVYKRTCLDGVLPKEKPALILGNPDGIDGYREFRELQDMTAVSDFLKKLEG